MDTKNCFKDVVVDVAKSAARAPSGVEMIPCIVPNSQMYRHQKKKMLTVEQILCAQGIFLCDFPAAAKWAKEKKGLSRDLAGNAFSTTLCMAVILCCLANAVLPDG
jgi:hypothetical protein